ncbi:MAG: DUF4145 domain-containing protein [Pikeienuella sp.]|uniref:DUF4145 domain-containing protein n=1 Tax=Pikeienuella sp. TaxID=2831957 RepID=UPI003918A4F9
MTSTVYIARRVYSKENGKYIADFSKIFARARLMPESSAKPQPNYIPGPIVEDYKEACRIKDLSPKASATLARRCIQGMIRDFCGISEVTLYKEIEKLRDAVASGNAPRGVSEESIDAIDHVRKIGNIGAHMQKNISKVVSVDSGEPQILIDLVETLFEEWYVSRERRRLRLESVKALAESKYEVDKEH